MFASGEVAIGLAKNMTQFPQNRFNQLSFNKVFHKGYILTLLSLGCNKNFFFFCFDIELLAYYAYVIELSRCTYIDRPDNKCMYI
jgi:hypothetical protein